MPFCEECGAGVGDGRQFCEDCGPRLSAGEGPDPSSAEYWLAVGIERDENIDPSGALEAYDRALEIGPDFYEALFNRGFDLILLARYREAEDAFARVLRLRSDDPFAMKHRALALHELGRDQEAKELMHKALKVRPDLLDDP